MVNVQILSAHYWQKINRTIVDNFVSCKMTGLHFAFAKIKIELIIRNISYSF